MCAAVGERGLDLRAALAQGFGRQIEMPLTRSLIPQAKLIAHRRPVRRRRVNRGSVVVELLNLVDWMVCTPIASSCPSQDVSDIFTGTGALQLDDTQVNS